MINNNTARSRRNKWLLVIIFLIFFGPMIAAHLLFNSGYRSHSTTNHGVIIKPPLQLAQLSLGDEAKTLKGHWLLFYVNPQPCAQTCTDTVYKIRQIRTSLGKERDRIIRVLVQTSEFPLDVKQQRLLATEYKGTVLLNLPKQQLTSFFTDAANRKVAMSKGLLYLVDPLGNVIMYYDLSTPPRALYEDITRLLKYSHIG